MDIKKSKIIINLSANEKNTFSNFYNFLDDLTLKLYEADAEHTEFCTILTNVMEDLMYLQEFWGKDKEESPLEKVVEVTKHWQYIDELKEKFIFRDCFGKYLEYPNSSNSIQEWLAEFEKKVYNQSCSAKVYEPLSLKACKFFTKDGKFGFLAIKEPGCYNYNGVMKEWNLLFSKDEINYINELRNKYTFYNNYEPLFFPSMVNSVVWRVCFVENVLNKSTCCIVKEPLSTKALEFFANELGWPIPHKQGTYTYYADTHEWGRLN